MPHRTLPVVLAAVCLLPGCGKKEPAAEAATPEPSPTPEVSLPQPTQSARTLYVKEAFQTESSEGIHDFPLGAEVSLIAIIEEDYLVERNGVSVRISRAFFSETPIPPAEPSPTPLTAEAPAPTPDMIPSDQAALTQPMTTEAATPSAEPVPSSVEEEVPQLAEDTAPTLTPEDRKIEELTTSIRDLNERIRSVRQKLASGESQKESAEVKKLQKERDQLSKELTGLVKP